MSNGCAAGVPLEHVVVTGGAGYIGSVLVPLLLQSGYRVTVYDLFNFGSSSLLSVCSHANLELIRGDVCDRDKLAPVIASADAVIHLAAVVGYPACDANPAEAKRTNVAGTRLLASLVHQQQRESGRRLKLVYASTGSCYGALDCVCTEETPVSPLTLYGETKAAGEALVLAAGGVVLRLATLFGVGPRVRFDLLINQLTQEALLQQHLAIYESAFRRTFLHVRDAARAFLLAIQRHAACAGEVFNVGDERMNMTKGEAVAAIAAAIPGTRVTLATEGHDLDRRDYAVSYRKIAKLGFTSRISIHEGIRELVKVLPTLSPRELDSFRNV